MAQLPSANGLQNYGKSL